MNNFTKITVIVAFFAISQQNIHTGSLYVPTETLLKAISSQIEEVFCTGNTLADYTTPLSLTCQAYGQ